jgi:acid phosphatase family membrane protein YuiD
MNSVRILAVPVIGWIVAQLLKYLFELHKDGFQLKDLYTSGGFPSSHASSTVSLATYIGFIEGWGTSIFALSALMAVVVMYDSLGVRRTVEEHTKILQKLSQKEKIDLKVRNTITGKGHSPKEVFGGLMVGLAVGTLVALTV